MNRHIALSHFHLAIEMNSTTARSVVKPTRGLRDNEWLGGKRSQHKMFFYGILSNTDILGDVSNVIFCKAYLNHYDNNV